MVDMDVELEKITGQITRVVNKSWMENETVRNLA